MIDLAPNNPYGLRLERPVLAAAGVLGYGTECSRMLGFAGDVAAHGLGALISSTTTLRPVRGQPQIVETPAGLIYRARLNNPGIERVLRRYAPAWSKWNLPVVLSIAGADAAECAEIAMRLEGIEGVAGIDLALPVMRVSDTDEAAAIVAAVRSVSLLPLIGRLPPSAGDLPAMARAVVDAGADSIALSGGFAGAAPDAQGELVNGWLCGPAARPLALAALAALRDAVDVPLIAGGGITSAADAAVFQRLGVDVLALGTVLLNNPWAAQGLFDPQS
jgi:dihydroorotate dehydrogenase (NAD+) catalytic subunit